NSSIYSAIASDNKKKLKSLLETYKKKYPQSNYQWHALFDFDVFVDAINQVVSSKKIDLIIMGTNGATGAKEILFGSNTLHVVRNVNCPVIMVPEGYTFKTLSSILFSTTNCKELKQETIKILKDITTMHDAMLHVLNIQKDKNEPEHGYNFYLKNVLEDLPHKEHTLKGIPLPFAIESFEQLIPVDLHVMFAPKETFLDRFLFGSETSRISYGSNIPLMFLHKSA
ncbi:MAG: universal stress protein, partial [Flavobacteriaceae bacterium]|nr:universal stress protein [Flavobacteriaceae bacterium]